MPGHMKKPLSTLNTGEPASTWGGIIKAMGLVFGDIGTSPIYTLTVVFALSKPTYDHVLGILSLVIWTLTILVTVAYAWLATSLSRNGEGGAIVLREILVPLLKSGRTVAFVGMLTFIGVSLLIGDGVITPAISILSAVEGIEIIPGMEQIGGHVLLAVAMGITVVLFLFQSRGTDRIAWTFGPVMLVWFIALAVSGLASILTMPAIIKAVSPWYAIKFLTENGITGFFVLSEVILCATGGEALYADMGHLGRKPIVHAWYFVWAALMINYLGQGVFALQHPEAKVIIFGMVHHQAPLLYIPFLLLAVTATVIASQAMISGVFSVVYQAITTRALPLMKISFTSTAIQSQIYIGSINWMLMLSVLLMMLVFQKSANLAAAYGMAVTGSMTITGIAMIMIFHHKTKWKVPIAAVVTVIDLCFLASTFSKVPHGAYWSLVIAAFPLAVMLIWTQGHKRLFRNLMPLPFATFLISYEQVYAQGRTIPGTALFFTRSLDLVPPYVVHCILSSNIIYERNIFTSIIRTDQPYGMKVDYRRDVGAGLDYFEIRAGYMTFVNVEALLSHYGIQEKIIFYGVEDIIATNPVWWIFSSIKKQSANFVQFYELPASKLHGVVTRIEM
jgi:KUP system potassium uptake protein